MDEIRDATKLKMNELREATRDMNDWRHHRKSYDLTGHHIMRRVTPDDGEQRR